MISVCVAAYNREAMLARTLPTWQAAAAQAGDTTELVIVRDGPELFSAGAWRTLAVQRATGDVLVMLDADMAVPPDYLAAMSAAVTRLGAAAFPLYTRERSPGGPQSPGSGWGNAAFSRSVWERACQATRGEPYPTGTRWGGEDVAFAKLVTQTLRVPLWRRLVPGMVHLWHPKTGSPWYDGAMEPCVDGPDRA